jgi:hypothetical protein
MLLDPAETDLLRSAEAWLCASRQSNGGGEIRTSRARRRANCFQDEVQTAQRSRSRALRATLRASRPLKVGADERDRLVLRAGHQVPVAEPGGRITEPRAKGETPRMKVDELTDTLRRLVAERRALRDCGATWAELEQNRLGIVRAQQELSHAFIETHLSEPVPHAA